MMPREGIEPPTDDYKSTVIPFNYQGFGVMPKQSERILSYFVFKRNYSQEIDCGLGTLKVLEKLSKTSRCEAIASIFRRNTPISK